ncbi:tetratricopeptide repeat protein, partial [Geitlerinema sp. PCC 9228]|uniref:tetratricopeptide repeat protein n=1 Tax=Geitlerinema sp. PCC 9228 TaxID=111611 RepID=UPI000B1E35AB
MDKQRLQAYLSLIEELLNCPSGEESQVLEQHPELLDAGLVQTCELVAEQLGEAEREQEAEFVRGLAQQLADYLNRQASEEESTPSETQPSATSKDYLQFLKGLLQVEIESKGDPQSVYSYLEQHQDKLDLSFAKILTQWFDSNLDSNNSEKNQALAALANQIAVDIQEFPLGSRANNIEIAIAAYQAALQVRTRSAFPQDWAMTQYNLANAYSDRIRGERAENLEEAIAAYQAALQV